MCFVCQPLHLILILHLFCDCLTTSDISSIKCGCYLVNMVGFGSCFSPEHVWIKLCGLQFEKLWNPWESSG